MPAKEQKYFGEIALLLQANGFALIRPSMLAKLPKILSEQQEVLDASHIYFVCKKPRLRIVANSLKLEDDVVTVEFELSTAQGVKRKVGRLPGAGEQLGLTKKLKLHDRYNYFVELLNEADENIGNLAIEFFLNDNMFTEEEIGMLEVLYIGQAYGQDGSRVAMDRLQSHSTLQAILAEILSNEPHNEIFLLCVSFDAPKTISRLDGRGKPEIVGDRDLEHWINIHKNPLSESQIISLAEGCLIRYFRPAYNIKLKDSFPSTNHKILETCYAYDFNALITEINSECIGMQIFSEVVKANLVHIAKFDLHSRSERLSFFELSEVAQGSLNSPLRKSN